uniref:Protein phosphatase CheZ n=1 Tax=Desulfobacca acetoxidans TaxID=60893 RepID=A0A7V4G782_9BACT
MASEKRIELSLGQDPGELRLSVDGVTIALNLKAPWTGGLAAPPPAAREVPRPALEPPAPAAAEPPREGDRDARLSDEADYYRRISQEIYEGLGKLAKDINLTIQDLSLEEIIKTGMDSPGKRLDQARNQVNDVLQMTEQATLNIMNLVEGIRDDCHIVQKRLIPLAKAGEAEGPGAESAPFREDRSLLWEEVLAQAGHLDRLLAGGAPPSSAAPEPEGPVFPLAEVLQLLLEFCSNETVKQHLRAVQAKQEAIFDTAAAEQDLSRLGAASAQEDGFHQLPVSDILGILLGHCQDDRVKDLLNKILASVGKLFPISALPLEAKLPEVGFPEVGEASPELEEAAGVWRELHDRLQLLAAQGAESAPPPSSPLEAAEAVREVLDTVDRITGNLSRIVEALSFQDLSGQRLLKVLKIIRQLQVQVLTLLVAAGHKLQLSPLQMGLSPEESAQARQELDRLLQTCGLPSDEGPSPVEEEQKPLDQDAVNELLTSMGF